MIKIVIAIVVLSSCIGEPLGPIGEGEGEFVIGEGEGEFVIGEGEGEFVVGEGEGEGEPTVGEGEGETCAESLCLRFAVTGGNGAWFNPNTTTVRDGELVVYSDCVNGGAQLTSTNGSIATTNCPDSMMATVTTNGELSSPQLLASYGVLEAITEDDGQLGFIGGFGPGAIYFRLDDNGSEVYRRVTDRICLNIIPAATGTLALCLEPAMTTWSTELVRMGDDPWVPLRRWELGVGGRVGLAPLRNDRLAALAMVDFETSAGSVEILDSTGALVGEVAVDANEWLLVQSDGNLWVRDNWGGQLPSTHIRRLQDDGTPIDAGDVPCSMFAATGTGPYWFAIGCYTPTTFDTVDGPLVVDDEPRSYIISQGTLGGAITHAVQVTQGQPSFLSDIHVVDDVVMVSVTLDGVGALVSDPGAEFASGSKAWLGYKIR